MAAGISVHAVDVASGRPGEGMKVEIHRLLPEGGRQAVAEGLLGADGALHHPVTTGVGVTVGVHEVLFHIGDFFAATQSPPPPFLELVPFRFRVFDASLHYHLPIKFTPWGFSLYRGA
ncbi:hydroxyisourate hydrolase [Falsiroseomonas selenitidurans]|uniref:Hydroxyisourate hydrolase n=1 Tax=Falsiroseomonas selenitidurans TaxID=2716335 RepID=A0ABX1E104_9PROT|nr:hydroxyisourate hydrolase [Falsiroseomonas selenitidurans]NKC30830.1 hydroxyisourate hydrolase [Falsiroseomonas selenitidurans]